MARIQTCPNCGAGAGHNDTHCWRCGEALRKEVGPATTGVRDINSYSPDAASRKLNAIRDIGGRDLRDRERELRLEMEALEAQHRQIEKLSGKLEEERRSLENLKASLSAQEDELYTRAALLQNAMQIAEAQGGGDGTYEEIGMEEPASIDLEPVLAMERERIRREVEGEMAGQLERIAQLEAGLGAQEDELYTRAALLKSALKADGALGSAGADGLANIDLEPVLALERARIRREVEREMAEQLQRAADLEAGLRAAYAQAKEGSASSQTCQAEIDGAVEAAAEALRAQIGAGAPAAEGKKLSTGIGPLDQVLAGGLPAGAVVLITGAPGTMKSSLAYSILHGNAASGTRGMYLSLEQDSRSLLRQMSALGMDRDWSREFLKVTDLVELRRSMEGLPGNWSGIIKRFVENAMEQTPFQLLVLDSLGPLLALSDRRPSRTEVQDLFNSLRSMGLTALVISETPLHDHDGDERPELCMADGVIELIMKEIGGPDVQRWVRCLKMRGADVDTGYHRLEHAEGTFTLSAPAGSQASSSQIDDAAPNG